MKGTIIMLISSRHLDQCDALIEAGAAACQTLPFGRAVADTLLKAALAEGAHGQHRPYRPATANVRSFGYELGVQR